ncbi:MAG: hypothetical protein MMC33_008785 [Icmadophila ericetorum]|nr:hypothetical protein [Icmadophila ericetorum]
MSDNKIRYLSAHGGPPCGGRGVPGRNGQQPTYHPPGAAPPPYTPPPKFPHFQPQPFFAPFMSTQPIGVPVAPVLVAPVPASAADRPDVPGEKLGGKTLKLDDGSTFLLPSKTMTIHWISHNHQPWLWSNVQFGFTVHQVDCSWTVKELIKQLGIKPDATNKHGVAQCLEAGNGNWMKNKTFVPIDKAHEINKLWEKLDKKIEKPKLKGLVPDDGCDNTLEEAGWGDGVGTKEKPIWLAFCIG